MLIIVHFIKAVGNDRILLRVVSGRLRYMLASMYITITCRIGQEYGWGRAGSWQDGSLCNNWRYFRWIRNGCRQNSSTGTWVCILTRATNWLPEVWTTRRRNVLRMCNVILAENVLRCSLTQSHETFRRNISCTSSGWKDDFQLTRRRVSQRTPQWEPQATNWT